MLLVFWLGLGAVVIAIVVWVRSSVVENPGQMATHLSQWCSFTPPERFTPHRETQFFGNHSFAWWDTEHVREDGRTLAVIAFYRERHWQGASFQEAFQSFQKEANRRLNELEFHPDDMTFEKSPQDAYPVLVFRGQQRIEDRWVRGTTCWRFLPFEPFPFRAQTLGTDDSFPLEEQLQVLRAIEPARKDGSP
jgi:hypothetical protein